eukprot:COSAG02_NODE_703_length_18313_cov_58.533652_7_plen_162_part_00
MLVQHVAPCVALNSSLSPCRTLPCGLPPPCGRAAFRACQYPYVNGTCISGYAGGHCRKSTVSLLSIMYSVFCILYGKLYRAPRVPRVQTLIRFASRARTPRFRRCNTLTPTPTRWWTTTYHRTALVLFTILRLYTARSRRRSSSTSTSTCAVHTSAAPRLY